MAGGSWEHDFLEIAGNETVALSNPVFGFQFSVKIIKSVAILDGSFVSFQ
jgi:hypothetical protein